MDTEDDDERIQAVEKSEMQAEGKNLFGVLIRKTQWSTVAPIVKAIEEEPEGIRRYVLAAATNVCLSGGQGAKRAAEIIDAFRANYFDCGKAGLVLSCYEVSQ